MSEPCAIPCQGPGQRDEFSELETSLLALIGMGRREAEARHYARHLEGLLLRAGLVSREVLNLVAAEAHAIATWETACDPRFEHLEREWRRLIEDLRRGAL